MKRWAGKREETRRMRHEANKQLSTLTLRDTQRKGREEEADVEWKRKMKRQKRFTCECVEIEFDGRNNKQKCMANTFKRIKQRVLERKKKMFH